jgi:predicted nucleotidyltransferase
MPLKKRVSKLTPLIDFRLFGSRARGDADEYTIASVVSALTALLVVFRK